MKNLFSTPKHPRSVRESEHWIEEANSDDDAIEAVKAFFWFILWLALVAFGVWAIIIRPLS